METNTVRPVLRHPTNPELAILQLTQGFTATIPAKHAAEIGKYNWGFIKTRGKIYAVRGRDAAGHVLIRGRGQIATVS